MNESAPKKFKPDIETVYCENLVEVKPNEEKELLLVNVTWLLIDDFDSAKMTQWILPSQKPCVSFCKKTQKLVNQLYNDNNKEAIMENGFQSAMGDEHVQRSSNIEIWNGFEVESRFVFEKDSLRFDFFEYVFQECCGGRQLTNSAKIQGANLRRVNVFLPFDYSF